MNNKLCAAGSKMTRKGWWLWSALGLLALWALLLVSRCSPIEQDLKARTDAALGDKGHDWASASLEQRGRDTLITGVAPNETARDEAIQTAAAVYGNRVITDGTTLQALGSSDFGLTQEDGKTVLTGSLPDQGMIDKAVRAASDQFGADNVVNQLTLSDQVSSPSWLDSSLALLPTMSAMTGAAFSINDDSSSLSGTFASDEDKQALLNVASNKLGSGFSETTQVVIPGPSAEELAAAEEKRAAEEAEAERLAEEKRLTEEAEAARLAEEKQAADAAEAARLAEEKKAAEAAEAARLAEEKKAAEAAEAARLAEEKKAAEAAEAARLAEEKKAADEAETARLAEEKKAAEAAEAARLAEEKKAKAAEAAEAARLAEEKKAAEAAEAARLAEEKKAADEAALLATAAAQLAATTAQATTSSQQDIQSCQRQITSAMNGNTILFATSSAQIDRKSYPLLNTVALAIRQCGETITATAQRIEISGHTDSRGSEQMNLTLSDNRAKSVRDYLLQQGVRGSILVSKGYGESKPIADNNTAAGRQQNRRIQFTIQ